MSFSGDNKLTLNRTMDGTYLIQRLQKPFKTQPMTIFKDNPFSFGGGLKNGGLSDKAMDLIRDIFRFDYMGSAEFEFGAVPQAIRFIAEQASKNNLINGKVEVGKGETVYYLVPLEYEVEAVYRIKQLRIDEYKFPLKEHCGLTDYFDEHRMYQRETVGWLELDNGFMFFVDKLMFHKTCALFGVEDK